MPQQPSIRFPRKINLDLQAEGLSESYCKLGRYDYSHARPHLKQHTHTNAFEICYLAKGRQVYQIGGRDYILGGNDVFVSFPDEPHGTGKWPEEKGVLYWLILGVAPKNKPVLTCPQQEIKPLLDRLSNISNRCFATSEKIHRLFDSIFHACLKMPRPLARLAVASRIIELLLTVTEYAYKDNRRNQVGDLNTILDYIEEHPDMPACVATLAARMNLSESWFKAKFRKQVGMPPAEYILRRKVEKAKTLLGQKNLSVTDVAFRLGFSSSGYFATVFKRYTGMRPSDYRP